MRMRRGICQSPEGRQVFGPLSIEDNLRLGAYTQPRWKAISKDLRDVPHPQEKRKLPGRHPVRRPAADARHRPRP